MTNAQENRGWAGLIVAAILMMLAAAIAAPAQTLTTLHNFDSTDGASPKGGLVQATNGNLYGTTYEGGANEKGTVFKITAAGTLTTLHSFDGTDGGSPTATLVQATDGNLYGTTYWGGAKGTFCPNPNHANCGTVFKITLAGTLTTLYSFCTQAVCSDGQYPNAGLVQGPDGNLYGTTFGGGNSNPNNPCNNFSSLDGCGTVFKITPAGMLTTLHSFCTQTCTDGGYPTAGLILAADGNFYGTTSVGGTDSDGTVFRITPAGTLTTLYSFCSRTACTDGIRPNGLIQASDGNFYGTTYEGGANEKGTVFKITAAGTLTTLHSFDSTDGQFPDAGVIQATDGNFYGTTFGGGANSSGTVFSITSAGTLTTLHSFDSTDGSGPYAGLLQDTNGKLYGTTFYGGTGDNCTDGCGTVFSLSVGLGPLVKTVPTTGKVGSSVTILGTTLTGATSVTFNGTAATFTVESPTAIKTTVPTGGSTGPVQVVTPSGTLTSNVNFQVEP